jgi:hypothetical protein
MSSRVAGYVTTIFRYKDYTGRTLKGSDGGVKHSELFGFGLRPYSGAWVYLILSDTTQ